MKPKHTKVTTYKSVDASTIKAITESYFDDLASRKETIINHKKTNFNDFLADLISIPEPITKHLTRRLVVTIETDEYYQPTSIVREYIIKQEDFKRR